MSDILALVSVIEGLAARLDSGEAEASEVERAVTLAHELAPEATRDEQAELARALDVLEDAVQRSLVRLGTRLRQLGAARNAIGTYNTIRPHTTAQRMRTRA